MRLIDADQFGVISFQGKSEDFIEGAKYVLEKIDEAPTVERQHGEWKLIHPLQENDGGAYICSVCQIGDWNIRGDENFCPFCGADMRKEGEAK